MVGEDAVVGWAEEAVLLDGLELLDELELLALLQLARVMIRVTHRQVRIAKRGEDLWGGVFFVGALLVDMFSESVCFVVFFM